MCHSWIDHRKPFGKCLVAVADASTFQAHVVYAIASDGQLLQYDVTLQEWADLGRPTWSPLGPTEGIAVVNDQNGDRSMFLLSAQGSLVELFLRAPRGSGVGASGSTGSPAVQGLQGGISGSDGSGGGGSSTSIARDGNGNNHNNGGGGGDDDDEDIPWHWFDHGFPDGDRIVGPPGGLINLRSIFMVSENGTVYERYWDERKWVWVSHGHSGVPTLPARPVALDNRHIFFLRGDNLLTERFWNGIHWVWSIHRVPEHGSASTMAMQATDGTTTGAGGGAAGGATNAGAEVVSFCNPEVGARDSCAPPVFSK